LRIRHPEPNGSRWATPPSLIQQWSGQSRVADADYITEVNDNCWYAVSRFRRLYPEYNDLSDKELTRKLYALRGITAASDLLNPWATLGTWAIIAFGIPLAVLVLGASLVWAVSGLAAKRS